MPFGCVPIRQQFGNIHSLGKSVVSNAFRLCAYPADFSQAHAFYAGLESPMPFGCVPIRQQINHH